MMRPLRCRPQTAVVLLACWSLVTSHWSLPGASAEVMDSVVAVVNDDVITQRELERALVAADRPELDVADLTPDHPVWRRAVEQLVEERLIIQAAKRAGLAPDEAAVEGRLQQMQANFRSVEEFHAALADEGLTTEELKVRYTEQWLMQRIVEREVRAKLRVTPTEVAREYEAHRDTYVQPAAWLVRMIVIKPQAGEPADAARRRAERVLRQARSGGNFAELARRHSQGPHADEGGSLGYVEPAELLPALDAALRQLKPDEVSEIIETEHGFHLLKVEGQREDRIQPLASVQAEIERRLLQQKFEQQFAAWLSELKSHAYIVMK